MVGDIARAIPSLQSKKLIPPVPDLQPKIRNFSPSKISRSRT
ncbi:hypothetical protein OROGR_005830 [Orobanche gracilis]